MKEAKFILPLAGEGGGQGHKYAEYALADKFPAYTSCHVHAHVTADDRNGSAVAYSAAIRPEEYLSTFRRIACAAARLEGCCAVYLVDCEGLVEIVNVADRKSDEEQEHHGTVNMARELRGVAAYADDTRDVTQGISEVISGSAPTIAKKTPWLNELWLTRDGSLVLVDNFYEPSINKRRTLIVSVLRSKSRIFGTFSVDTDGRYQGPLPHERDLVTFVAPYR